MQIIDLEKFYGRKSTMDLLKKRVLDLKEGYRQNIAFLGTRYVGKSIILHKFIAELDDPDFVAVYIDLENKDLQDLYARFAGSLLYRYLQLKKLFPQDDLKVLIESAQEFLPQTVKHIKKIQACLAHDKRLEAYREMIELPETFARETNTYCVLMFDEFQGLEALGIDEVFQELGKKIMTQKRCLYVITSSFPCVARKIVSEKLSLLFGDFEVLIIEPLDLKSSGEFIRHHLGEVRIGSQLQNFLIDFTGGHPLYLRLICQELVSLGVALKQHEVFTPLLVQGIENVTFHQWGLLNRHFDLLLGHLCAGKGNLVVGQILLAIAGGRRKIKDLIARTNLKPGLLTAKLNRLMEMEIVAKNGNYYYLKDKLLRYWLKHVFKRRREAFSFVVDDQKKNFREDVVALIEEFKRISHKGLSWRIIELLNCFEDESFQINGRRYKLPVFTEIIPTKILKGTGESLEAIKACAEQGDWVIVLNPDNVCDNDISSIVSASRSFAQRPKRCILVSLAQLDENTRVRALQEKMWIWNEKELNALLNFYDQPYIV